MKPLSILAASTSIFVAFAFTSSAFADHHKDKKCGGKKAYKQERMAEFDADGDGKLSTAEKEVAKAARFQEIDIDKSGDLTAEELSLFRKAKKEERRSKMRSCRFDKLDVDKSGTVSLEEYSLAKPKMQRSKFKKMRSDKPILKATHSERIEKFDLDGDGKLSDSEKKAARIANFEAADVDSDGQLTLEEIENHHSFMRAEMKIKMQAKRFERLDTNGDSVASLDEFVNSEKMKKNWK